MNKKRLASTFLTAVLAASAILGTAGCGKKSDAPAGTGVPAQTTGALWNDILQKSSGTAGETAASGESAAPGETKAAGETSAAAGETTAAAAEQNLYIESISLDKDKYPVVDGSTATLPLGRMLYRMATGAEEEEAEEKVTFTKTTNSYLRLMTGDADLVIAYEAGPAAKERDEYADLNIQPIGLDALVFLCNEKNTVKSLTTEEIQKIYTGKITNWKEVGGEEEKIIPFQRPENSGSQTLMQNLMMKDLTMMEAPVEWKPGEMGDLVENVASYNNSGNALGYSVYYYAGTMYQVPGLRFMAVDGVLPDTDTIRDGKYGYVNPFYAAVRKDADPESPEYKLFQWLTGADGQSLIDALGYVSIDKPTKMLPEKYAAAEYAAGDAGGYTLVINAEIFDNTEGLVVFDEKLKPAKRYDSVCLPNGRSYCCTKNDLIIAGPVIHPYDEERKAAQETGYIEMTQPKGLFSLSKGAWVANPVFDTVFAGKDKNGKPCFYAYNYGQDYELPVRLRCFDLSGKEIYAEQMDWESVAALEEYDSRYDALTDNGEADVLKLGGNSEFITNWDTYLSSLTIQGKTVRENCVGLAYPYGMPDGNLTMIPENLTYIEMWDMKEGYGRLNVEGYFINDAGELLHKISLKKNEYFYMAGETFYMLATDDDYYQIRNMEDQLVFEWRCVGDGEYEYPDEFDEYDYAKKISGIENNGGHFVRYRKKVYFRVPEKENMTQSGLWGDFDYAEGSGSAIWAYDISTGKAEKLFADNGSGKLWIFQGKIYGKEIRSDGDIWYSIDPENGKRKELSKDEAVIGVGGSGRFLAAMIPDYKSDTWTLALHNGWEQEDAFVTLKHVPTEAVVARDHVIYIADNDAGKKCVYDYSWVMAENTCLGEIPAPEGLGDADYPQLFQADVDKQYVYVCAAYYEGSANLFRSAQYLIGSIGAENSLSVWQTETSQGEERTAPQPFETLYGALVLTDGVPNTAGTDPKTNEICCFDEYGSLVPLNCKTPEKKSAGRSRKYSTVAYADYLPDSELVFYAYYDLEHTPESDVGWRMSYVRNAAAYHAVDVSKNQDTELYSIKE